MSGTSHTSLYSFAAATGGGACCGADVGTGTAKGIVLVAENTGKSCLLAGDIGRDAVFGGVAVASVFGGSQCKAAGA